MKRFILILIAAVIFFSAIPVCAGQAVLRILHVNDFHGFADPYKPYGAREMSGGIAWLAAAVENMRDEMPTLLLSAGDMIQGHNWANLFRGQSVIELMNAMKFDAMVAGNHEFDFGQKVLQQRISEAEFPVLAANVEGLEGLKPYAFREFKGISIGIIGVVTEETPLTTHPRNVAGLRFLPPEETVRRYVDELRPKVDVVIVLSHLGHEADRRLAERVEGIDVIVGGHSHTKLMEPVTVGRTVVLQAWEHAKALGLLYLTLEDGRIIKSEGRLIEIRPVSGKEDRNVSGIVEKYRSRVDAVLDERVGEALVDLDGENTRKQETNLGDFIADVVRMTAGADAAIIGGGSIRTSIRKGDITAKDIYNVSPFNNYIVAIRLTGRQIKEALEHGVSALMEGAGRFPQVSGLRFTFSRKAASGEKVKAVDVGGAPLDPDKDYVVATDDFLAAGGDGYLSFGAALRSSRDFAVVGGAVMGEKLVYNNSGKWLRDVLIDYIREKKEIGPVAEGRITEVE